MLTSLRVRTQGAPSFAPSVRAGLAGVLAVAACALWLPAAAHGAELPVYTAQPALERPAAIARLKDLIAEALQNNPELRAARNEQEAAAHRIAPAGALDDPMLEAGVLNLPTSSFSFAREDMTMKMLGLSQRIPYPGKRDLKRDVAQKDADSVALAYQETANRIARELKVAYYDLALATQSARIVQQNRALVAQLLKLAEGRYTVAQGSQTDVLRAQTQLSKMSEELIKLEREQAMLAADANRVLGRKAAALPVAAEELQLTEMPLALQELQEKALANRPQLRALQMLVRRNEQALELARKDRYPDFDVRFAYGQRDRMPDGIARSDVVSLTVAMNLPVWGADKTAPRIAEALAMRDQALNVLEAQRNEAASKLAQALATAAQNLRTARLYRSELVPQSQLTAQAALSAYQVNRGEFAPLLESQMMSFSYELAYATAVASYNKALADIDFLTGGTLPATNPQADGSKP